MSLPLRPYQQEAIQAVLEAESKGIRRPLISHPTGTGKTVTFCHLIAKRPKRALVLVHRDELIRQTQAKVASIAPELRTGVVKAQENETGADVVIASVQTIARKRRMDDLLRHRRPFSTVVVDEAHHASAPSWKAVLEALGSYRDDGPLTVGFTATPARGDGKGLGDVWQKVVHKRTILQMIAQGYLVPVQGMTIGTDADFSHVRVSRGDLAEAGIGEELTRSGALGQIAGGYVEFARDRKGVAFTPTVETGRLLAAELRARGISAEHIHGGMPMWHRRAALARLKAGETQVMCNAMVLTEGFDEPSIECVVIARPTKSHALYLQMVGRGTRLHPGKTDLLLLDVAGVTGRHELATATNLGITADSREEIEPKERVEPAGGYQCSVCLTACGDPDHFCAVCARPLAPQYIEIGTPTHPKCRAATTGKVDLFASRFRWLPVEDGYCLPTGGPTIVIAPRDEDRWAVAAVGNGGRLRVLHEGLPFGYAQGIGEDFARDAGAVAERDAYWLNGAPTAAQLGMLRRFGMPEKALSKVRTKGQASDLITRVIARNGLRKMRRVLA